VLACGSEHRQCGLQRIEGRLLALVEFGVELGGDALDVVNLDAVVEIQRGEQHVETPELGPLEFPSRLHRVPGDALDERRHLPFEGRIVGPGDGPFERPGPAFDRAEQVREEGRGVGCDDVAGDFGREAPHVHRPAHPPVLVSQRPVLL